MAEQPRQPRRVAVIDAGAPSDVPADELAACSPAAGLVAAIDTHPSFERVSAVVGSGWDGEQARRARVDLVVVVGPPTPRASMITSVLADGFDVLALPVDRSVPEGVMPLYQHRYAPALRSAVGALAGGRIGLPWNVQVDHLLAGGSETTADDLLDQASPTIDAVLSLLRLPTRRVYVPVGPTGVHGTLTIQCDHDHDVLSTMVVGSVAAVPADHGFGVSTLRNRYRITGSHGELLVDALRPRVRRAGPQGRTAHWDGPSALSGLLDAVVTGGQLPQTADIAAVHQVLRAARESLEFGRPVDLVSSG